MWKKTVSNRATVYCWIAAACIALFTAIIQSHMLLNWDVSFLLYVSDRTLANGTFVKNIFYATPTILHLYMIPVIISKIFLINIIWGLRITVFLIALVSLILCYNLLMRLFLGKDKVIAYFFFITLALVFFILPAYELGQREHFMMMLTYPYFCLAAARLKKEHVSRYLALFIGLLAGIGFSIKPFFLINFVFIELFILFRQKRFFAWARIESITILAVSFIYTVVVLVFFPELISFFYPLIRDLYYGPHGNLDFPLSTLIFNNYFLFILSSIIFSGFASTKNKYTDFSIILFLTLIGFIISYLGQKAPYYYRVLPSLSQGILLITLSLSLCLHDDVSPNKTPITYSTHLSNILILLGCGILVFAYPLFNSNYIIRTAIAYKPIFST